ncbi:MAG: hypothetical protein V1799_18270 [bacterium]
MKSLLHAGLLLTLCWIVQPEKLAAQEQAAAGRVKPDSLLAQDSSFVAALSQLSVYALDRHNYTEAAQIFGKVIHFNKANYREAERAYAKALQFDEKNRDALFYTGMTSERLKKSRAAKNAFQTFLKPITGNKKQ